MVEETNHKANGSGGFKILSQSAFRGLSTLINRAMLASYAGKRFDSKRNYYDIYGYLYDIEYADFLAKYRRQDVAKRIVDAPVDAVWNTPPEIDGGSQRFNSAWLSFVYQRNIWNKIERADKLSGIGRFSLLLIGMDDSRDLSRPVDKSRSNAVTFMQPYSEASVKILEWDEDPVSPDFGRPLKYRIQPVDPTLADASVVRSYRLPKMQTFDVHKDRVLHITQNPTENELFGIPQLEPVFNILDDLMKVAGGSAEMFWLNARQGLHIDVDKDMEMDPDDAKALADETEEYHHELRRAIRTRGAKVNTLTNNVQSPEDTFMVLMRLLSGTTGIPLRILLGSEAGHLASEQDRANWAERIEERRHNFAEPIVLQQMVDKLVTNNVLPRYRPNRLKFIWPSAFKMSPLEQAQMMAQKARAVANLSKQPAQGHITTREEARKILLLDGDLPANAQLIEVDESDEPQGADNDDQDPTEQEQDRQEDRADEGENDNNSRAE